MENNLVKQLEDKKKELIEIEKEYGNCEEAIILEAEIAILEQAIAEMQKQRQDFIDIINSLGEIRGKSNDLQCIKLGESFSTNSVEWLKKELLKQLNQPNSERKE